MSKDQNDFEIDVTELTDEGEVEDTSSPEDLNTIDDVVGDIGDKPEEAKVEEVEEAKFSVDYNSPQATIEYEEVEGLNKNQEAIAIPSYQFEKLEDIAKVNEDALRALGESSKAIMALIEQSGALYTDIKDRLPRFYEEGSDWKQHIETSSGIRKIKAVPVKDRSGELRGEGALIKISNVLGLGNLINIPLPHSGIWVTIKPPADKDIIDVYNTIARDKYVLGRATSGYAINNFTVYVNHYLFNFALRHIHSTNNKDISVEDLGSHISVHDLPILMWGLACSMYPSGYNFTRVCYTDVESCTHQLTKRIKLEDLYVVDNSALTSVQKDLLIDNRPNRLNKVDHDNYMKEFSKVEESTVKTSRGLIFKLRSPTFDEYTTDGIAWVNSINNQVDKTLLDADYTEDEKYDVLTSYVNSSILRQYNFYIEEITFEDGSSVSDRTTINRSLELISGCDITRKELIDGIVKFVNRTTVATIGIAEYECPSCGATQKTPEGKVGVIPLDVIGTFFLVYTSRVKKVTER